MYFGFPLELHKVSLLLSFDSGLRIALKVLKGKGPHLELRGKSRGIS